MVSHDQVVIPELGCERGNPLCVGFSLIFFVETFLETEASRNEADHLIGEWLSLEQELDFNRFLRSHGEDWIFFRDDFQSVSEDLVETGLVFIDFVESGANDEKRLGTFDGADGLSVIHDLVE